jgi:hypothetical protein
MEESGIGEASARPAAAVSNSKLLVVGSVSRALGPFFQNSLIDFFTVYLHLGRCLDADTYLISLNP